MDLSTFDNSTDSGSSFMALLESAGMANEFPQHLGGASMPSAKGDLDIPHGTTVVASRFSDGVIIAGDRRATSGNLISHRNMQKVFPADNWSAVAISGAAGFAMEMVKFFQMQLEHYEKVEGRALSLEGKANQLSIMVRGHLPAAMQGMAVVPIFAGFDRRRKKGRLFVYDVTGGRYEEEDFIATGSGMFFARTAIKLGYSKTASRDDAVDLMVKALFAAADDDSATGGPDSMRGIYPSVAVITESGYEELEESDIASRFDRVLEEFFAGRAGK